MKIKTILIIEDDLDLLKDTKEALEKQGYKTICCSSIVKAKEAIRRQPNFNLVFTDLNLVTTGLNDCETNKSYGSMIAGWIFIKNYIFTNPVYKNMPYVIRSAFVDDLYEYIDKFGDEDEKKLLKKEACFEKIDDDQVVFNYMKRILGVV